MKPVVVFDLNETLLDMASLDATFAGIFAGDGAESRKRWFAQVLELFLTVTITGTYRSFDSLTDEALQMLAAQRRLTLAGADRAALKEALGRMPAHDDVHGGLELLRTAGFTLATLTNSTRAAAEKLVQQAGLADLLPRVLSADTIERYKPAREAYAHASSELDVEPQGVLLVAAHAWDISGALAAGCEAAFIERPGKALSPGAAAPQYRARDVRDLATQLVARHGGRAS